MRYAFPMVAFLTAGLIGLSSRTAMADEHAASAKKDTLSGEVVDLACFLGHGAKGKDHAQCAKDCIQKGLPVGLLTDKGEVYLAIGPDHKKANDMLAKSAALKITVVGEITENSGMKLIEVHEIVKK